MKNGEAIRLLEEVKKVYNVRGDKFTYGVKKNIKKLQTLDKNVRSQVPQVPEYREYESTLGQIEVKYRKKIVNSKLSEEDRIAKDKEVTELETKYAGVLKKFQESENIWYQLLDEEAVGLEFYMVSKEDVEATEPKLTLEQRLIIDPFEIDE